MQERYYFIVNPISGSGRGKREFEQARALLEAAGACYAFVSTQYHAHAKELARAALAAGERCIVAVGGDGTVNEVASVLAGTGAAMGILPFGTGNDFSQALQIPQDTAGAVAALLSAAPRRVDAARSNDAFFVNVSGFGFDVDVVRYTEKYKKRFNGMLPYLLGVMQSLLHLRPIPVRVEPEEGECFDTTALLFSACNGTQFAGGMHLAPLSDPADGLLDICILKGIGRIAFLQLLPRYIKGEHLGSKHIVYFKARRVTAAAEAGLTLNLDGELGSATPVTFEALPGALTILAPTPAGPVQ